MKGSFWSQIGAFLFGWRKGFGKMDFALLKTMMLLAAVDGDISVAELGQFRKRAEKCRGFDPANFAEIWIRAESAAEELQRMAGSVTEPELVNAFVKAAFPEFVDEVVQGVQSDRDHAFAALEEMAESEDGISEIERKCLVALARSVRQTRERMLVQRYVVPGMK